MSSITDIKSTLTLKALKKICEAYHIPDEVHPQIPTPNQTIHEMLAGKIGVYTSQDSLKICNDRFFWVDAFACPASFPWNASTTVSNDPFPKSSQYNAEHYATLVAYPAPFHKYPEPFLCLVGISRCYTLDENTYPQFLHDNDEEMDLFAFIRTVDPTKVRICKRQCGEDEPKLLDTTVGRTVPLLPVAPARAQNELDASVDRLFDEEGSGNEEEHHDSADGGQGARTLIVSESAEKLSDDHGGPGGPFVAGKSRSTVQRLLARAVLNAEVRGEPVPTLPFVTSYVSATPEREDEHPADSITGLNLRTICAPSSAPIIATVVTATAYVATTTKEAPAKEAPAKEAPAKPSLFSAGSSSVGGTDPVPGGFSDVSGSEFLVGGIRIVVDPEFDLQKFFASICGMEHDQLFTEFNVGAARQISLSAEVRMRAEYNIKEKRRLKAVVEEKDILLKTKDEEIDSLNAQLLLKEAEAAEAIYLRVEASRFEIVEKSLRDEVKLLKERNVAFE
ncbi:hypothetical protein Tco_1014138, partial [Tanacetum coccineum]